jgi:hypothetical protein
MAQEIDVLVDCVLKIIQATMGEMLVDLADTLFAQTTHSILPELKQTYQTGRIELQGLSMPMAANRREFALRDVAYRRHGRAYPGHDALYNAAPLFAGALDC